LVRQHGEQMSDEELERMARNANTLLGQENSRMDS